MVIVLVAPERHIQRLLGVAGGSDLKWVAGVL